MDQQNTQVPTDQQNAETPNTFNEQNKKPNNVTKIVLIVVVLLGLVGGIWFLVANNDNTSSNQNTAESPVVTVREPAQITITKDGFVPAAVTIAPGQAVVWTNQDNASHAVAADPHPEHDSLPGLDSGPIDQDSTYEYTFEQAGQFTYHDEFDPTVTGTITVE